MPGYLPEPKITLSVLTYNRREMLRRLLNELSQLQYEPLEIIVVDNHSTDGTHEMVLDEFPMIKLLKIEKNIGAAGRNYGLRQSSGEIIVTLDDDIGNLADADLRVLGNLFREHPPLGAVNFKVVNSEGKVCNWVHHCKAEEYQDKEFLTYEITEGAVAFRKKALEFSGVYHQNFFLSHEGPDLALRIFDCGYTVIYVGNVSVTHYFAENSREPWRNYYYDTRNQIWLAMRHYPFSYGFKYLTRGLIAMLIYSLRDGYVSYWFRAVISGIKGMKYYRGERQVLHAKTMKIIRQIDGNRPSIFYLAKKRLLSKSLLFK